MSIYMVRHAETMANQNGVILGRRDSPLTERGFAATGRLAAALAYEGVGRIFSSPLGRAVATAEAFATASGWPITVVDGLCELSCGEWEGRPRLSVLQEGQPLRSSWTFAPPGGESCEAAEVRVAEAIRLIKPLSLDLVIIVGHAGLNQVFFKTWLSLEAKEALAIRHPHDLLYTIAPDGISWLSAAGQRGKGWLIQK